MLVSLILKSFETIVPIKTLNLRMLQNDCFCNKVSLLHYHCQNVLWSNNQSPHENKLGFHLLHWVILAWTHFLSKGKWTYTCGYAFDISSASCLSLSLLLSAWGTAGLVSQVSAFKVLDPTGCESHLRTERAKEKRK